MLLPVHGIIKAVVNDVSDNENIITSYGCAYHSLPFTGTEAGALGLYEERGLVVMALSYLYVVPEIVAGFLTVIDDIPVHL
jgi:hypothetical protein